jgi:hypothetical protein
MLPQYLFSEEGFAIAILKYMKQQPETSGQEYFNFPLALCIIRCLLVFLALALFYRVQNVIV